MLSLRNLECHYGGVRALHGLSLEVADGEALALLGCNGAGKTTTLKAVMGLVRVGAGSIHFDDVELSARPAHEIARLGIGYVPQGRRLFAELTVSDNLRIGQLVRHTGQETLAWVLELFPVLAERRKQRAGSLSGGEQQMLAIARALCLQPRLLLLDEPTEGLMPSMVAGILRTLSILKARGVGVLMVEQKVEAALAVADRIAFLENGWLRGTTTPERLHEDATLLHRYVGVGPK